MDLEVDPLLLDSQPINLLKRKIFSFFRIFYIDLCQQIANKYTLDCHVNPAIPRNYLVIFCRHSALLGLLSALGALGRRFESCRPDQL